MVSEKKIMLPHGPGFRLLSGFTGAALDDPNRLLLGYYYYRGDEWWLASDHFPEKPIMPAVITLEVMVQNAIRRATTKTRGPFGLRKVESFMIHQQVKPETELTLGAKICWGQNHENARIYCTASIGDKIIAESTIRIQKLEFTFYCGSIETTTLYENGVYDETGNYIGDRYYHSGKEEWSPSAPNLLMPGCMILEAGAQLAGQICGCNHLLDRKIFAVTAIKNVCFEQCVRPNTKLCLRAEIKWLKPGKQCIAYCSAGYWFEDSEKSTYLTVVTNTEIEFSLMGHVTRKLELKA